MIDTIKFLVPISQQFIKAMSEFGISRDVIDNERQIFLRRVFSNRRNIGSYDYHVNLRIDSLWENLEIEFSVPKYVLGHNIHTINLATVKHAVNQLHSLLTTTFAPLLDPDHWKIKRIDLCYSWKFEDQRTAERFLESIKCIQYKGYKKQLYPTTVMFAGKTISHKFYLKLPEFFNGHGIESDYVRIKYVDEEKADTLLQYASGVLRYEITIRAKSFLRLFEVEKLRLPHLTDDLDLMRVLSMYFEEITRNMSQSTLSFQQVKDKIAANFNPKLARNLYLYYCACQLSDAAVLVLFKEMTDRSTLYRYDAYLRQIGVSKVQSPSFQEYCFRVPSIYAVREETDALASSSDRKAVL